MRNHKNIYVLHENNYIKIENTPEAIAEHICTYGLHEDITIYTEDGDFLLSTFGIYIDKCPNQRFLQEELLPVLIPKQIEVEDRVWGCVDITEQTM